VLTHATGKPTEHFPVWGPWAHEPSRAGHEGRRRPCTFPSCKRHEFRRIMTEEELVQYLKENHMKEYATFAEEQEAVKAHLRKVWDVLVKHVGAQADGVDFFLSCCAMEYRTGRTMEYRFQGKLGYGGKVWLNNGHDKPPYVNCYQEDETPALKRFMTIANKELAALERP